MEFFTFAIGLILGLAAGFHMATDVATKLENRYKSAHCEHIQNRAEYDKCFKEFGEGK